MDRQINAAEAAFLHSWMSDYVEARHLHPFNELIPVVHAAVQQGEISDDAREDILWLCDRLRSEDYDSKITADMQRLHGIVGGVIADGVVTETEVRALASWLDEHDHLRTCWPYDEIQSLITTVMADQKIDEQEQRMLKSFFSEFVQIADERTIVAPSFESSAGFVGLCAICPEITFEGKKFCITGPSNRYSRSEFSSVIAGLGGEVTSSLTNSVSYLIIGADGNPCWAYACYGRKVEKAVELRKKGSRLLIVHENDLHDAVADQR